MKYTKILFLTCAIIFTASLIFAEEGENQLMAVNYKVIIYQIINFVILLFLLQLFLYKPMKKMLSERKRRIAEDTSLIEKMKAEVEQMKQEVQIKLNQASERANEIISGSMRTAEEMRIKLEREAEENAKTILDKAYNEIEQETKKALMELNNYVSDLAIMAATKIIGISMNNEINNNLVKKYIEEFQKTETRFN